MRSNNLLSFRHCLSQVQQRLLAEITRKQSQLDTLAAKHKAHLASIHASFETRFNTIRAQYDKFSMLTVEQSTSQLLLDGPKNRLTLRQVALKLLLRRMVHAKLARAFSLWSNFRPLNIPSAGTMLPFKVIGEHLCRDALQAVQSSFASAISDAKTMPGS